MKDLTTESTEHTEDLFPEAKQDSPYVAFVKRHGIEIVESEGDFAATVWNWIEPFAGKDETARDVVIRKWRSFRIQKLIYVSDNERDAVKILASECELGGYKEVNW